MYIHKDVDIVTLRCQIRTISEFVNVPSHFPNLVGVQRNQFLMLQRNGYCTEDTQAAASQGFLLVLRGLSNEG